MIRKKNVLIVVPTIKEISPLFEERGDIVQILPWSWEITKEKTLYKILLTNIGAVNTILGIKNYHFVNHYIDTIIMGGVAGSYDKNVKLGEIFLINEDQFADFGIEYNNDIQEFNPYNQHHYPYKITQKQIPKKNAFQTKKVFLKGKKAISVNATTGNSERFRLFSKKYPDCLESMEGAAFFYVCNEMNIPCVQIRSVSNYVNTPRSEWNLDLAINNLCDTLNYIIDHEELLFFDKNN